MNKDTIWRYTFLGYLISILPIMIGLQLIRIQTDSARKDYFNRQHEQYIGYFHRIEPARGLIYDRYGSLLAGNKKVYEVGVELWQVRNPETIAMAMASITDADYNEILEIASIEPSENAVYAVLANDITPAQQEQLEILQDHIRETFSASDDPRAPSLSGLVFYPHLRRTYPEKSTASNIIGFVGHEGNGFYGVEGYYDDILAGDAKMVWLPTDPNRVVGLPDTPPGVSLVLTIDREIQAAMEELADRSMKRYGADSATIMILDPKTGEVIAMASTPRLDLNEYYRYSEIFTDSTPFNRAISQTYEPGSVYKVLTLATGLDSGAITPQTEFLDTGMIEVGGAVIYNWNYGAWGPQDMTGCMQHSLNVCLAWIAQQIGAKDFYEHMQNFGIGRRTGIDLAGEARGRLKIPGDGDWYEAELGTNSFGQGVSATALQMASAVSALANDGKIMAPHIVTSMINKGEQHDIGKQVIAEPISAETAHTATEMLAVSLEVEASDALVTGYRIAGKTGTGEIATPIGYTTYETNASFVGWGPVDDPRFVVYVWLEKPSTSIWGSETAAPMFSEVVEELVVLMKLPPDDIRLNLQGE